MTWFFFQTESKDQSQDSARPGVIVSNHVSYLDILYHMSSSFPSFVAKVFEFLHINVSLGLGNWYLFYCWFDWHVSFLFFLIMSLSVLLKRSVAKLPLIGLIRLVHSGFICYLSCRPLQVFLGKTEQISSSPRLFCDILYEIIVCWQRAKLWLSQFCCHLCFDFSCNLHISRQLSANWVIS